MANLNQTGFFDMMNAHTHTILIEQKIEEEPNPVLFAFAAVNVGESAMTFDYLVYDPTEMEKSPGKLCWALLILEAQRLGAQHVYIGFGAENSPKIGYKLDIKGLEFFYDQEWHPYKDQSQLQRPKAHEIIANFEQHIV